MFTSFIDNTQELVSGVGRQENSPIIDFVSQTLLLAGIKDHFVSSIVHFYFSFE